jgi:peroxiredoxin
VIAVSSDGADTLKSWRDELKASNVTFVSDEDLKLIHLFDVKMPVLGLASRHTFVIGKDRKVLSVEEGSDAINPEGAIRACPLHRPAEDKPAAPKDGG